MKLLTQIDELAQYVSVHNKLNPKVSASTIGWQIEHTLKAMTSICESLGASNPKDFKKHKFTMNRWVVMTFSWIPRGKGKTPEAVNPKNESDTQKLTELIELAKKGVHSLSALPKNAHFLHPYFGTMHKKQAIHFMGIHNNHHLKIIRDINNSLK